VSLYIDLLRQVLTRSLFIEHPHQKEIRKLGRDWPSDAETMIGDERMQNIQKLAVEVIRRGIPGDFMECGVWRGGACILMRAILAHAQQCFEVCGEASPETERRVWVADSFAGLPPPDAQYPADAGDQHHTQKALAISRETVEANFRRYGLLDDRVKFLPGFFKESLPGPVEELALLRVDADMYESTTQALEAMYPKLSWGGYVIVDDYRNIPNCHKAVNDFRARHAITEQIYPADSWCAIYWEKTADR
jgi:O-methyltransferase